MKLVRIFLALIIVFILLLFLLQNNVPVGVNLIIAQFQDIPLSIVILASMAMGVLIGYGIILTSLLVAKNEIRSLRLKNRRLSEELNDLRNVAIDEGIYDIENGDQ